MITQYADNMFKYNNLLDSSFDAIQGRCSEIASKQPEAMRERCFPQLRPAERECGS